MSHDYFGVSFLTLEDLDYIKVSKYKWLRRNFPTKWENNDYFCVFFVSLGDSVNVEFSDIVVVFESLHDAGTLPRHIYFYSWIQMEL